MAMLRTGLLRAAKHINEMYGLPSQMYIILEF